MFITDEFLTSLWFWALSRVPVAGLVVVLDTLPSSYAPRARG